MSEKLRVGILGAGFIAPTHCAGYKASPRAELEIVYSRSPERARSVAQRFGFRQWTTDWHEVVSSPDVDLVDVLLPNRLHSVTAIEAAKRGKHVIVEKPLATTLAEADAMIEAAESAGVLLMYAENLRFAPDAAKAREIVESGAIGRPFLIRTTEMHSGPHADWFWDGNQTGGGAIMDMGVHGFLGLEWLMGDRIVEISAWTDTLIHPDRCKNGSEDTAVLNVRFANGGFGQMVNSWGVQGGVDIRTDILGDKGSIWLDHGHGSPLKVFTGVGFGEAVEKAGTSVGWSFPSILEGIRGGHVQEIQHFVECAATKQKPILDGLDGRRILELVLASYESARSNRPVTVASRS